MTDARADYRTRIIAAEAELESAGPIHRRDLRRQIANMRKELKIYDHYQRAARQKHRTKTDYPLM